jgi:hypothetical protein
MSRKRFLAKSYGDNPEGTKEGLVQMLRALGTYNNAVIVVPILKNVNASMLVKVLDEPLSSTLIKDREVRTADGKTIHLCGQKTLKNYRCGDVYLDLWGSEDSIYAIEALPSWHQAILVTWHPQDSQKWEQEYQVTVIYDDKRVEMGL